MRYFTLAMLTCSACFASIPSTEQTGQDKRECGPGLPGNADGWADAHEGNNAWAVRVRRGPTGSCPNPNPRPDRDPQGIILVMTHEPNGPDRHPVREGDDGPRKTRRTSQVDGPQGMDDGYYVSMTNDHFAGPDRGLD